MELKQTTILITCIIAILAVNASADKPLSNNKKKFANDSVTLTQRQLLKDFAFCRCLYTDMNYSNAIKKEQLTLFFQKDGSAGGYTQTGGHDFSAYEIIDSAVTKYVENSATTYISISGSTLSIMKCLDFYRSRKLDSLVNSLDSLIQYPEPNKTR